MKDDVEAGLWWEAKTRETLSLLYPGGVGMETDVGEIDEMQSKSLVLPDLQSVSSLLCFFSFHLH